LAAPGAQPTRPDIARLRKFAEDRLNQRVFYAESLETDKRFGLYQIDQLGCGDHSNVPGREFGEIKSLPPLFNWYAAFCTADHDTFSAGYEYLIERARQFESAAVIFDAD